MIVVIYPNEKFEDWVRHEIGVFSKVYMKGHRRNDSGLTFKRKLMDLLFKQKDEVCEIDEMFSFNRKLKDKKPESITKCWNMDNYYNTDNFDALPSTKTHCMK